MGKYKVYIITNDVNDKVYVGQTINTLKDRFYQHCRNPAAKLDKAMQEIGAEHFSIALLDDTATNSDELAEKEAYYIRQYNSIEH